MKDSQTFEYKNVSLGKNNNRRYQNPLKSCCFYETSTPLFLDNQLNEIQKLIFLN
jgi:hypothetical protein